MNGGEWYQVGCSSSGQTTVSLPPNTPIPRIRFITKTKLRRVRCVAKRFAPQEFSGRIGNGLRLIDKSHSLAGGRGIVWCWRCGNYATQRPHLLCQPCPGVPAAKGVATLARLRQGKPPYPLKGTWPEGEVTLFKQLKVVSED